MKKQQNKTNFFFLHRLKFAAFLQENPNALEQLEKFRTENLNGLGLSRDEEAAKSPIVFNLSQSQKLRQ